MAQKTPKTKTASELKYYRSSRFNDSLEKASHDLDNAFSALLTHLAQKPDFGAVIQGQSGLRKTRMHYPGYGKSGGYRVIYRLMRIDEIMHIIFLECYFKGKKADLSAREYAAIQDIADELKERCEELGWQDTVVQTK